MRNLKSIQIWNEGEVRNFVGIGNIGKTQKWKIWKSGEKGNLGEIGIRGRVRDYWATMK